MHTPTVSKWRSIKRYAVEFNNSVEISWPCNKHKLFILFALADAYCRNLPEQVIHFSGQLFIGSHQLISYDKQRSVLAYL